MLKFCPGCGKEVTASIASESETEVELVGFLCNHKWKQDKFSPGAIQEGAPIVPPSTSSSVSPETLKQAGHWGHPDEEKE